MYARFDEQHPAQMPTALEAGTLNVPGLAGLCAGVEWILAQGVETLCAKETALAALFYKNIRDLPNVKIYGDPEMVLHAPIISHSRRDMEKRAKSDGVFCCENQADSQCEDIWRFFR